MHRKQQQQRALTAKIAHNEHLFVKNSDYQGD